MKFDEKRFSKLPCRERPQTFGCNSPRVCKAAGVLKALLNAPAELLELLSAQARTQSHSEFATESASANRRIITGDDDWSCGQTDLEFFESGRKHRRQLFF
jgi:hypothetical protein